MVHLEAIFANLQKIPNSALLYTLKQEMVDL